MKPERVDAVLDARGMLCPMPVVKVNQAIRDLPAGAILEVLATDKGACIDIPAWCAARSHQLVHRDEQEQVFRFYVRKSGQGAQATGEGPG